MPALSLSVRLSLLAAFCLPALPPTALAHCDRDAALDKLQQAVSAKAALNDYSRRLDFNDRLKTLSIMLPSTARITEATGVIRMLMLHSKISDPNDRRLVAAEVLSSMNSLMEGQAEDVNDLVTLSRKLKDSTARSMSLDFGKKLNEAVALIAECRPDPDGK